MAERPTTKQGKHVKAFAPGALHRARWMSKMIYCLKIYLFRSQFHLTKGELRSLREFNLFVLQLYLRVWYTCPSASSALRNDLGFAKALQAYKDVNKIVADVALKCFSRHLWYLSEPLAGLAFFDSELSHDLKRAMVQALAKPGEEDPPKRLKLVDETKLQKVTLPELVSKNSMKLLNALDISLKFLQETPSKWEKDKNFIEAKRRVSSLKVVNDAAERGVALIQEFNADLTTQEEQKQFLLQMVEKHRKEFPNSNKATVL